MQNLTIQKLYSKNFDKITDSRLLIPSEIYKTSEIIISTKDQILTLSKGSESISLAKLPMHYDFIIESEGEGIQIITRANLSINTRKLFHKKILGTYKSLILGAIKGLTNPYTKKVLITGVGYKFQETDNNALKISIGYSNPVFIQTIPEVKMQVLKNNISLNLSSCNKQKLGWFACRLKKVRKFNHYKMTGISLEGEKIIKREINKKK